jgi:hypothetical protein
LLLNPLFIIFDVIFYDMERFIKYKRHFKSFLNYGFENELQEWLDSLISEGWEIINYKEIYGELNTDVVILAGKKQNNIL